MIDFELLKTNTQKFINILFPNFKTCYEIYHDPDLDSDNTITKLMAMISKKADFTIEKFKFNDFINEKANAELFDYIKKFLPNKFENTSEIIFNTLAIRILFNVRRNEIEINKNADLFRQIINEEVDIFIKLVKSFTEHNDYLFYSNNLVVDESLLEKPLTRGIVIKSTKDSPIFELENVDYNIRIYQTIRPILVKALALIFNEKVEFLQFADAHTRRLEEYGCKNLFLYPINDTSYYISPYHKQLISFGPKITIDEGNYEMVHKLLTPYMDIINNLEKDDYKNVALEFFFDSLEKYGTAKITYNVITIEALFNISKQDVKKAVVQRGLKILQNYYTSEFWEQIEEDLAVAYDIRSGYAHGANREHKKTTSELIKRISEYTRIILLTFLLISSKVTNDRGKIGEKKYINEKLIDKSLFYPKKNYKLCEILKNIPIYIKDFNKISEMQNFTSRLGVLE